MKLWLVFLEQFKVEHIFMPSELEREYRQKARVQSPPYYYTEF